MRLFIAVEVERGLKDKILDIQGRIRKIDADIKYVEPENLHYNIKFLGETAESKIEKIKEALENAVKTFETFKIHIFGLGAFPSKNYAKVLWIGVKEGKHELIELAKEVDRQLGNIEIKQESREFQPHLTLGRVKSGKNKENLLELIKELENIDIGIMQVKKVILFKSELTPNGPVYEQVYSVNLK